MVSTLEVIAGGHGSQRAVVKTQGSRGGILNVDWLTADVGDETGNLGDFRAGDKLCEVEPMDAEPHEVPATSPFLLRIPL